MQTIKSMYLYVPTIKLTQLPIGSEGGVILGIRIGVCCTILQIASLFHMSFLTPVFRPGFLKSVRVIRNGFLTFYSVLFHAQNSRLNQTAYSVVMNTACSCINQSLHGGYMKNNRTKQ